ncbi:MAG: RidA family protein [Pseudomonadota bacterium]
MKSLSVVGAVLWLSGCVLAVDSDLDRDYDKRHSTVEYLKAPGTENMDLPFSAAVRSGETLYLSGMLGIPPGTRSLVPGGIQPETRQTLENISQRLEDFGYSMDDVVKCTVFLADMAEWGAMNEVYKTFFRNPPARSAVGVSGIALDGRVEIECIAHAG